MPTGLGYRPGHSPRDGICRFCVRPVRDCVKIPVDANVGQKRELFNVHVHKCAARKRLKQAQEALLSRYPRLARPKVMRIGSSHPWIGPVLEVSGGASKLNDVHCKASNSNCFICCAFCTTPTPLSSQEISLEHCLVDHDMWVPPGWTDKLAAIPHFADDWNIYLAGFPLPLYISEQDEYYVDPKDAQLAARSYLQERLDVRGHIAYGIRTDIDIRDDQLCNDNNDMLYEDQWKSSSFPACRNWIFSPWK